MKERQQFIFARQTTIIMKVILPLDVNAVVTAKMVVKKVAAMAYLRPIVGAMVSSCLITFFVPKAINDLWVDTKKIKDFLQRSVCSFCSS